LPPAFFEGISKEAVQQAALLFAFDELTTLPSSCSVEFVEVMDEMGVKEEFAREKARVGREEGSMRKRMERDDVVGRFVGGVG
jgi:hypothetical protein